MPKTPALTLINPSGNRSRVPVETLPFTIGRQADNNLVLRDNRASRNHAQIVQDDSLDYWIEDLQSRHGVWVNGSAIQGRMKLASGDRIEFGVDDSYQLIFTLEEGELERLLGQLPVGATPASPGAANLAKLRSLVEVARALQSSLSTEGVLSAVLDAALVVTDTQRGFVLLKKGKELEPAIARDRRGLSIPLGSLLVPPELIMRALAERRELLSMRFQFDHLRPEDTTYETILRGVVCVPLVHVRTGGSEETLALSTVNDTVGVLYLESAGSTRASLDMGDRELLQTLAIEASTILENARLLEQERQKLKMEDELNVAREIQRSLLPRRLPSTGWFRAAGSSVPSLQVGGDYYDVRQLRPDRWAAVIADVSGKGVSSALLAGVLQGVFVAGLEGEVDVTRILSRLNDFLLERTEGEKYATIFFCILTEDGLLRWTNAGHCAPFLLRTNGVMETLEATGMPVGLVEGAEFEVRATRLRAGDKIIAYTDGVSEARNLAGACYDLKRLRDVLREHATSSCSMVNAAMLEAVQTFTGGAPQADDLTALVIEYQPG